MNILVTGAGGFIGHHLVKRLRENNPHIYVRGVDLKYPEWEETAAHQFMLADLRELDNCVKATKSVDFVYNLAADMGGIGYITQNHADIAWNNAMINLNMLKAAVQNDVVRFLFSSSACVYPQHLQLKAEVKPLTENSAIPADPEPGYGWEKLWTEQLCWYFYKGYKLDTKVVRFHNVYGPLGTFAGGREKSPAAICRKVALAQDGGSIEVWGDGKQTRSYIYIDDCIEGLLRIMDSDYHLPLNLGTDKMVSITEMVDMVCKIAGKQLHKQYNPMKPQGVRGRNSDNSRLKEVLGWQPEISLEVGLKKTYEWIHSQCVRTVTA